jgi:hypothetical protein
LRAEKELKLRIKDKEILPSKYKVIIVDDEEEMN